MAPEHASPMRLDRARALEHIEIHEDAILLKQHDAYSRATGLGSNLAETELNRRTPLAEIDLETAQHNTAEMKHDGLHDFARRTDQQKEEQVMAAETTSANFLVLSTPQSHNSSRQISSIHDRDINRLETLSPANHKIRFDRKPAPTSTGQAPAVAEPPACLAKRHMLLTPAKRSSMNSEEESPVTEISNRQQGQGEHNTSKLEEQKAQGEATLPSTSLSATPVSLLATMATPLAKRSISNKENVGPLATPLRNLSYDILEAAVVEAATPPSHSRPQSSGQSMPENAMATLDELGEAVNDIVKDMSASPPDSVVISLANEPAAPNDKENADVKAQPKAKKVPVVRTTKAAQARISLAHGPKDVPRAPAWGRPRESIGISSSLRQSFTSSSRIPSVGSTADSSDDEKKPAVIPHSKPRPMSMSFPTPPPPHKSTKAPTRSTFALPGEAVAAKLRAARQEREKKDEPKVFKARPVPATVKNAPAVRQTNTSRARESLGGTTADISSHRPAPSQTHRRASSVACVPAGKRLSMSLRPPLLDKMAPVAVVKEVVAPRPSTSLANIGKPRLTPPADTAQAVHAKAQVSVKYNRGREVFNRSFFADEAAEREKRAKGEATRKARAEAAERSRQLSREWAEKKRRETLDIVKSGLPTV